MRQVYSEYLPLADICHGKFIILANSAARIYFIQIPPALPRGFINARLHECDKVSVRRFFSPIFRSASAAAEMTEFDTGEKTQDDFVSVRRHVVVNRSNTRKGS
jgi:hypothetical protein